MRYHIIKCHAIQYHGISRHSYPQTVIDIRLELCSGIFAQLVSSKCYTLSIAILLAHHQRITLPSSTTRPHPLLTADFSVLFLVFISSFLPFPSSLHSVFISPPFLLLNSYLYIRALWSVLTIQISPAPDSPMELTNGDTAPTIMVACLDAWGNRTAPHQVRSSSWLPLFSLQYLKSLNSSYDLSNFKLRSTLSRTACLVIALPSSLAL